MIINKTPHPITIVDGPTFPACPKDELIRLASRTEPTGSIDGIPTSRTVFGEPEGLPAPQFEEFCPRCEGVSVPGFSDPGDCPSCHGDTVGRPAVFFIVSQIVKSACPDRDDLLVPVEVVRDETGAIVGCRSLGR